MHEANTSGPHDPDQLRRQAEQKAAERMPRQELPGPERLAEMVHELQVHQVELEMQNQALRQAQAEIEAARDRYADLYDFAPVGYVTLDKQGIIREINLTACKMLGRERSRLLEYRIASYLIDPDKGRLRAHLEQCRQGAPGREATLEVTLQQRGGGELQALLRTVALEHPDTGQRQYRMAISDITQRKRTERALDESEYRYRTLFNSIDEGFCIIEMIFDEKGKPIDYRFLEVNQSFEKQTGLSHVRGQRIRELDPEHETHWFEIYGHIALTGEPARFEDRAEQLHRWFNVYAFRFGCPENRHVAVLFHDITPRKQAEENLRQSEQRLALAASGAGIGLFDWNIATGEIAATEQKTRLVGLTTTTTTTTTTTLSQSYHRNAWLERVHPSDVPRVQAAVRRTLTDGTPYEIEYRVVWPDGTVRWLDSRGVVEYDPQGCPHRMLGVAMDITERKRAKEMLEERLEELNAANNELTRFNRAAVNRELRMIELKKEINDLCDETGRPRRYPLEFEDDYEKTTNCLKTHNK